MTRVLARVGALVVAVGLVLGALALRDRGGGGDGPDAVADDRRGSVTITCGSDLGSLCSGLDTLVGIDVERIATADRAAVAAGAGLERAWLVPVSWADVVDGERRRNGTEPLARSGVLASSPIVLVGYEERMAAIARACGVETTAVTIGCLDGIAGSRWEELGEPAAWGRVRLGHAGPESAAGLLTTAAVAAAVAGPDFGAVELADPLVAASFASLEQSVDDFDPGPGGHVRFLRTRGPSVADLVVAPEVDALGLDDPQPTFGRLLAVPAAPLLVVELVLVAEDDTGLEPAAEALARDGRRVLEEQGWRIDGAPAGSPVGDLPQPVTRPDGPSLTALRAIWGERFG